MPAIGHEDKHSKIQVLYRELTLDIQQFSVKKENVNRLTLQQIIIIIFRKVLTASYRRSTFGDFYYIHRELLLDIPLTLDFRVHRVCNVICVRIFLDLSTVYFY